jgi:hypothetical protein
VRWHFRATAKGRIRSRLEPAEKHCFGPAHDAREPGATLEDSMLDFVMLALGFGFFVAAIGYTYACERL